MHIGLHQPTIKPLKSASPTRIPFGRDFDLEAIYPNWLRKPADLSPQPIALPRGPISAWNFVINEGKKLEPIGPGDGVLITLKNGDMLYQISEDDPQLKIATMQYDEQHGAFHHGKDKVIHLKSSRGKSMEFRIPFKRYRASQYFSLIQPKGELYGGDHLDSSSNTNIEPQWWGSEFGSKTFVAGELADIMLKPKGLRLKTVKDGDDDTFNNTGGIIIYKVVKDNP